MPLELPEQRLLDAAIGYVQLGMYHEANESLDDMDAFWGASPEVLAVRAEVYRGLKKWELMLEISKRLHEFQPNEIQWLLDYAFASRRALSIEVAKEILLKSASKFPKEAVIYFNLACYECQMSRLDSAKTYLRRAFAIEPRYRQEALEDKDLEAPWESLAPSE